MAVTWKIKRESGTETNFSAVPIRTAVKRCVNQDTDTCDVSFGYGDLLSRIPWDYDEEIQILRDATVFFRGWVRSNSPSANGQTEELTVQLVGPWWHLENLVYMQPVYFVTDPDADPTPAGAELAISDFTRETALTAKIFLGEDWDGHKANTKEMIEDILDYAIQKGAPIQVGTIDTGIDVPREAFDAVTCAEAIRKCLRWTPDQTTRFDYTTDPPTLHIRKRDNLASTTFALADEETMEISIRARPDLQLPGVQIQYIQNNERELFTFRTMEVDEAGSDPTGIGALIVPVELFGSYVHEGSVVAAETPPSGIAQMVYDHWSQLHYEGRILFVVEDNAATDWLAYKARVTGGHPDWATMDAVIQASVDTISTSGHGTTEITLGPPQHLGPQDLIGLLRAGKTHPPSQTEVLQRDGGSPGVGILGTGNADGRLTFGPTSEERQADVTLNLVAWWINTIGPAPGSGPATRDAWDRLLIKTEPGGSTVATIRPAAGTEPPIGQTELNYTYLDAPGVERFGKSIWTVTVYVSYDGYTENTIGSPNDFGSQHESTEYTYYLDGSGITSTTFIDLG